MILLWAIASGLFSRQRATAAFGSLAAFTVTILSSRGNAKCTLPFLSVYPFFLARQSWSRDYINVEHTKYNDNYI